MNELDRLTPETLTDERAQSVWEDLREMARARHAREARPGRVAMRAICLCGYPSIGNGGALCRRLRELAGGGDEAEWLAAARSLRDELQREPAAEAP